jgi:hypothetical protein
VGPGTASVIPPAKAQAAVPVEWPQVPPGLTVRLWGYSQFDVMTRS